MISLVFHYSGCLTEILTIKSYLLGEGGAELSSGSVCEDVYSLSGVTME